MRENGGPDGRQHHRLRRAAGAIHRHHQGGGGLGSQARRNLEVDLGGSGVEQGGRVAIEGHRYALAGEIGAKQRGQRTRHQRCHCESGGVHHRVDRHHRRSRRWRQHRDRLHGQGHGNGGAPRKRPGIDDDPGLIGACREAYRHNREDPHTAAILSRRVIQGQPAGTGRVADEGGPVHDPSARILHRNVAGCAGHGAAGDGGELDGSGIDRQFRKVTGLAIAEHGAVGRRRSRDEPRNRRAGGRAHDRGDRSVRDLLLRHSGGSRVGNRHKCGELHALYHRRIGVRHLIDRVTGPVGERHFAYGIEQHRAQARGR